MVQGKEGFKSSQERLEGFLHALRTHDLPIQNEYLVRGDYTMKSGYSAVETLLTKILITGCPSIFLFRTTIGIF